MCSELFRIPIHLFSIPLFGWGLLLLLWIIGFGGWLAMQLRKGMTRSDAIAHAPVFLLTAAILVFLPKLFPGGLPIRGYGVMLLLAGVSGIGLAMHRARQNRLHPDTILSLVVWLFVCGIAGARVFFVVEYWERRFSNLPFPDSLVQMLMFTEGGLVVYGSLIGATVAFVVFCRRHKLPMLAMADILAPSLVIGLALGRIGCLLNGCCYGGPADVSWAVTFPIGSPAYEDQLAGGKLRGVYLTEDAAKGPPVLHYEDTKSARVTTHSGPIDTINGQPAPTRTVAMALLNRAYWNGQQAEFVLTDGRKITAASRSKSVHPTQVYSAMNGALLAWLTWTFYAFRRRDGQVIGLLLTVYPISRFLLESIRIDEADFMGTGMSISQNLSIALLLAMIPYWAWLQLRPGRLALLDTAAEPKK